MLRDRARLILRLTTQLVEDDAIAQDALDTARETFSDREIVELILTCGYYRMLAAVMRSVDIDLDDPVKVAVIDASRDT